MKQNRDAVSLSLLLMLAVVLVAGIVVLWQLPEDEGAYRSYSADAVLRVYGLRSGSPPESFVVPPENYDVRSSVRTVAAALSRESFGGLPIHVIGVETIDGELRAFVDLSEPETESRSTWIGTYFQGSALAGQTKRALVDTFLQPEFRGQWLDSVTFYYQGRPFAPLDHIDLGMVFDRRSIVSDGGSVENRESEN